MPWESSRHGQCAQDLGCASHNNAPVASAITVGMTCWWVFDEATRTTSCGAGGERSSSVSMRNVPLMSSAVLRTLLFGTGVPLLRQTQPLVFDLKPWTGRHDVVPWLVARRSAVDRALAGQTELSLALSEALR